MKIDLTSPRAPLGLCILMVLLLLISIPIARDDSKGQFKRGYVVGLEAGIACNIYLHQYINKYSHNWPKPEKLIDISKNCCGTPIINGTLQIDNAINQIEKCFEKELKKCKDVQ